MLGTAQLTCQLPRHLSAVVEYNFSVGLTTETRSISLITCISIWTVTLLITASSPEPVLTSIIAVSIWFPTRCIVFAVTAFAGYSQKSVPTSGEAVSIRHAAGCRWPAPFTWLWTISSIVQVVTPSSRRTAQYFYFTEVHYMSFICIVLSFNGHISSPYRWCFVLVVTSDPGHYLPSIYYLITDVVVSRCHIRPITH